LGTDYDRRAPEIMFDPVFCPTPYQMVFRSDQLREAFNRGLAKIRENGVMAVIESRYTASFSLTRVRRALQGCSS
jgi:ABC-type amino acid transport substrate-binding protein